MGLNRIPIGDLALGINKAIPRSELRPGEAFGDTQNVQPVDIRGIRERPGLKSYIAGSESHPNFAVRSLFQAQEGGVTFFSLAGDLWYYDGTFHKAVEDTDTQQAWQFAYARNAANADFVWAVRDGAVAGPQKIPAGGGAAATWANAPFGDTVCYWRGRMVVLGVDGQPERLFYSDLGNPEAPASTAWGTNFSDMRGPIVEPLMAAIPVGENLLVFKQHATMQVYDINTFNYRTLGDVGAWAPGVVDVLKDRAYFLGPGGLWSCDGTNPPRLESQKIPELDLGLIGWGTLSYTPGPYGEVVADPINERLLISLNESQDPAWDPGNWEYYPPNTKNNPRDEGTFWKHSMQASSFLFTTTNDFINRALVGLAHASGGAKIKRWDDESQASDDGASISSLWNTRLTFQEVEPLERLRRLNFRRAGNADMDVVIRTLEDSTSPIEFAGTLTGRGSISIPESTPGYYFDRVRPEARLRDFWLQLSSFSGTKNWQVLAIEAAYRGGKEHTK